ncbi:16S rRNA (cytosine(1402)-N(4))-methyltransferase RsmH [Pigmentiphaga soli]|uniref:Ribosomal RNA small subunit methyltransferase H n=1 Tax=Pigmentiphaga soli TaxID=1007095 RepID=A0ABP8HQ84_9BURK
MATTFQHRPVLLAPTIDALAVPAAGGGRGVWVDATFGRGGHARALLARLGAGDRLVAFDKDPQAVAAATELAAADPRLAIVHAGFGSMRDALAELGIGQVNGIMMDLGISSPQIDDAARGFSFMRDGPLDMRMDTTRGETAAQWLARASIDEMREVIARYGEERFAFQIAKAIAAGREKRPLETTGQLAELVAGAVRTREKGQHPATRTFQAVRIHVNQELEELPHALAAALELLAPGGRLAVISFHSLEDRIVKQFIAAAARPGAETARLPLRESERPQPVLTAVGRVLPSEDEVAGNPRARSAVLRVAERTGVPLPAAGGLAFVKGEAPAVARRGAARRRVPRSFAAAFA